MKRKAYSYSRLSTEKQLSGQGLERQKDSIEKYVRDNNLILVENFEDIGLSGYTGANKKIGKFGTFIRAIEDGEIDSNCTLIVESLDRISRQEVIKAQSNFIQLINAGVEIVTLIDNQKYNSETIQESPHLMFISLATMIRANEESEVKSKRLKSVWNKKRTFAKSKIITKKAPAWLIVIDGKFEEKGSSFKTIKKIFDLSISRGMGTLAITKYLNEHIQNYPTFSSANKWTKSYITKIIKNPSVYGELQSHITEGRKRIKIGDPIPDYYPKVIKKETFLLAQQLMSKRALGGGGRHAKSYYNIFFKLLKCGNCGGTLGYFNKGKKGGKRLGCYNALHNNNCDSLTVSYDEFENKFINYMNEINWRPIIEDGALDEKRNIVLEKLATLKKDFSEKTEDYDKTMANISTLETKEMDRFLNLLKGKENNLQLLQAEIEKFEFELSELNIISNSGENFEIDEIIKKLKKSTEARQKINNQLRSIITEIKVFHSPMNHGHLEYEDFHPVIIRNLEKTMTPDEVLAFINNSRNLNHLSKLNLHFQIMFKTGVLKEVYPFVGTKIEWISELLASFNRKAKAQ